MCVQDVEYSRVVDEVLALRQLFATRSAAPSFTGSSVLSSLSSSPASTPVVVSLGGTSADVASPASGSNASPSLPVTPAQPLAGPAAVAAAARSEGGCEPGVVAVVTATLAQLPQAQGPLGKLQARAARSMPVRATR